MPGVAPAVFGALAQLDNPSYLLSSDLRIVRVNEAWTRLAERNGGGALLTRWGRGAAVLDAISGPLRTFYRDLFERALVGEPVHHDYDCSSDGSPRVFRMMVLPLPPGFLAVTHSLRVEPGDVRADAPSGRYVRDGIVNMCSCCRRVRRVSDDARDPDRWDWLTAFIDAPPANVSHGLCAPCARYYYR